MTWDPNPVWGRGGAGRAEPVPSHPQLSLVPGTQSQRRVTGGEAGKGEACPPPQPGERRTTRPRAQRAGGRRGGKQLSPSLLSAPSLLSLPGSFSLPFSSISVEPFLLGPVSLLEPSCPQTQVLSTWSPLLFLGPRQFPAQRAPGLATRHPSPSDVFTLPRPAGLCQEPTLGVALPLGWLCRQEQRWPKQGAPAALLLLPSHSPDAAS